MISERLRGCGLSFSRGYSLAKSRPVFISYVLFRGNNFEKSKNGRCLDCLLLSKFIIRFGKIDGFDHAQPA
jgi:hypothetical protein